MEGHGKGRPEHGTTGQTGEDFEAIDRAIGQLKEGFLKLLLTSRFSDELLAILFLFDGHDHRCDPNDQQGLALVRYSPGHTTAHGFNRQRGATANIL